MEKSISIWRIRKRLALIYQLLLIRYFRNYVDDSIAKRKGECLAERCPDLLICCGYCRWLKERRCTRYIGRPITCRLPPIDRIYIWLAGTKRCGFYWD